MGYLGMQSVLRRFSLFSVVWLYSFSLAFGDSLGGVIGNPATYYFYNNVGYQPEEKFSATIPIFVYR